MKMRTMWMATSLVFGLLVGATAPVWLGAGTQTAIAQDDAVPLEDIMGTISSRHKRLRRTIKDASQNKVSLGYVLEMQSAAVEAKKHQPAMAKSVPESSRAKFLVNYRKGINGLIVELITLENALLDGNQKAAEASYAKLLELKKTSHEKFIEQ